MDDPLVIKVGFDPLNCGCETTRQIFQDDLARTVYLLWRRNHITSQHFVAALVDIVKRIRLRNPKTEEELQRCFPRWGGYMDFPPGDVAKFCFEALPYVTGEKVVTWERSQPAVCGE